MIKAIVFDLDDTLFPEYEYVLSGFSAVAQVIEKEYHVIDARNKLIKLYNEDVKNVYNRLLDSENISYSADNISSLIAIYRENKPSKLNLYDGVVGVLTTLKKRGYKLGIITDGRVSQQNNKLDALSIREYFDEIIISDSLGGVDYRKPDRRVFLLMASKLCVDASEMVYIGDNPNKDFYISKELPIRTIRILTNGIYKDAKYMGDVAPHYVIRNYSELITCINKLSMTE